ncbi:uncharacterized protein PAC_09000 [Phialocephala subalpina]|uniref:Lysophospholipase n=1 Tax=Phialocephala subalpina TaxID=576137 RepID=A0A1L7X271_9HELO|nr:uncharacterized protein PAC_09000 [Phialocephala subalpina]
MAHIRRVTPSDIFKQISVKLKAGFTISFADYLGRSLTYEFVQGLVGGIETKFSSYNKIDTFDPGFFWLQFLTYDAAIYGITPLEFSAWSRGSVGAFAPTERLGTRLLGSFLISTSADAFNALYIESLSNGTEAQSSKHASNVHGTKRLNQLTSMAPLTGFGALVQELVFGGLQ